MMEYQCISCGEIKRSEKRCTCPVCGYTMYALPFDRSELLKSEIVCFLECLTQERAYLDDLTFKNKEKDENRFPGFEKIQNYVCASQKTEMFHERITNSFEQIQKHLHTPFHGTYCADLKKLTEKSEDLDKLLTEALQELELECQFEKVVFPEIVLDYQERPDDALLVIADTLLEKLRQLAVKIQKFIKQNNVYGTAYQKKPKRMKLSKEENWNADLEKCSAVLDQVLEKKYVVDIFDDGKKELEEMLKVLWDTVFVILSAPILKKCCIFTVSKESGMNANQFLEKLSKCMTERFYDVLGIIHSADFLAHADEDRLFELYNKMLDLDVYGYMKVNKGTAFQIGKSEKQLSTLIGLDEIKERIQKIKAFALANKDSDDLNMHMCFYGNPGTGKTEVARIIAGILYENKLLPTDKVIETDRSGLVAGYVGQTAMKTMDKVMDAMGGVLFIDEAYSLVQSDSNGDYGHEAVATLIKAMEDYRGKFSVILAGYRNSMQEMIATNPGFQSRIQFELDFPNYSRDELRQIAEQMLKKRKYTISQQAMEKLLDVTDVKRKDPNFANAREIRNILDQVVMCQNLRCTGTEDRELALVDVNSYIKDAKINLPTSGTGFSKKILTAEEELDRLIGLSSIKRMVKKIKAYAKRNKDDESFNMHMCFYGNPGTGKTEVARILSRILYYAGVLPEAKLTETDSHGLIGRYVGETAPKTLAKINDAMGGVLFIDEAYSLVNAGGTDGASVGYGEEAIAVLLKEMEDRCGQFCVILAGYKEEMKSMLSSNPGLESRIQFQLDFPDYTREELGEIAKGFLEKKQYVITEDVLSLVLDITEYYRNRSNFANARTVRNILEQVIMNQNLRTEETGDSNIIRSDVEDYIMDEGIDLSDTGRRPGKIGF